MMGPLEDIQDEKIYRRLPVNCRPKVLSTKQRESTREPGSYQVVKRVVDRRSDGKGSWSYYADGNLLSELAQIPLQYSLVLVHEWLWDHVPNEGAASRADIIYRANSLLHS